MSDGRQNSTVNLQELERQLREAARARQRAQASTDTLTGVQSGRSAVPPAQNSAPQPNQAAYQPGLPLSALQASQAQPSAQQSFRPLTQPSPAPVPQPIQPASPAMPQASSHFLQPAAYPQPEASQAVLEPRPDNAFNQNASLLKTDEMGDVYPPTQLDPAEVIGQDHYYSAAAYEEPAATAYDRYTEDQFPRIEQVDRSSTGLIRVAVWVATVAVLGAGGYFAYPLIKGAFVPSSQTAKAPPLIKADPNPVKVEPETQPKAENSGAPKDIISKHGNEDPKSAQIAPAAEQPTDLNAAVKAGSSALDSGSKPAIVPLVPGTGEPRLVKTVTVRADGSIIPEKSDPALAAKTAPPGPKVITFQPLVPPTPSPVTAPMEPTMPAKPVAQSPDFILDGPVPLPPERMATAEPDIGLPLDTITTPPSAPVQPAAAAPVATAAPVAPAASAAAAGVPGKEFAVQFGAPETEAKGNELKARVEKQFASVLAGSTIAIVKGESNGRPVFRVRAINYAREEANAVCQQVAAAGGQCFVSKNN